VLSLPSYLSLSRFARCHIAGMAVHMPPGVVHSGQSLPSEGGSHFRMAYFALLKE